MMTCFATLSFNALPAKMKWEQIRKYGPKTVTREGLSDVNVRNHGGFPFVWTDESDGLVGKVMENYNEYEWDGELLYDLLDLIAEVVFVLIKIRYGNLWAELSDGR